MADEVIKTTIVQPANPTLTKAEVKEAFKEGLKEWLDDRAKATGWWGIKMILTAIGAVALYFAIFVLGWKPN